MMWLFICSKCGHRVEQEGIMNGRCPGCGAASWLCHLLDQGESRPARVDFVTPDNATEWQNSRNKIQGQVKHRGGRPRAGLPVQKVLELQAQGKSLRDIATELGVSHMTIARTLKVKRKPDSKVK